MSLSAATRASAEVRSRWTPLVLLGLEQAVGSEVGAAGDPAAVDGVELAREHPGLLGRAGVEGALEVPVRREPERHPVALLVDDEPGRHRLHAAGRQAGHDLLPQHGADLVAVETVEDASRLLGLDEVHVELARVVGGVEDRLLGDLVEDHPLDRDAGLRLQLVEEVPGDRLTLAVLIGGEVELVGVLEQALELGDVRLLVPGHDVVGLEAVVDVDRQPPPRLVLDLGRGVRGALREVTDVADGGLDDIALAEVLADLASLRRGLDDHQLVGHGPVLSFAVLRPLRGAPAEHGSANTAEDIPGGPQRSRAARQCRVGERRSGWLGGRIHGPWEAAGLRGVRGGADAPAARLRARPDRQSARRVGPDPGDARPDGRALGPDALRRAGGLRPHRDGAAQHRPDPAPAPRAAAARRIPPRTRRSR